MKSHTVMIALSDRRTTIFALIGAFLLLELLATSSALAQAPSVIQVPGIVRDFRKAHPDFDITPGAGFGHYAGNISLDIGADGRLQYTGNGYRVNAEWTNKIFQPIAPHMFLSANVVPMGNAPRLDAGANADTWDSSMGPYVAGGAAPAYNIGAVMPELSEPFPFVVNGGNISYRNSNNGLPANTINADIHCDTFSTQRDTQLVIDGNVTILCEQDFNLRQNTHITLTPGSTLQLYFKGTFLISQGSSINMPPVDPYLVIIYNLGTTQMEINQSSSVCAIIYSPDAPLHLAQGDQFFGKFIGSGLQQDRFSGFHWDTRPWRDSCNAVIEDNAGTAGANSTGGISSLATFNEWYHDSLGTNLSMLYTITMVRNGLGIYEYTEPEFFPIDDRLYGNEGDAHNYFFTYTIDVSFTYEQCTGQYFEFSGADDAWLFINGQLVMDLGGVLPGTNQVVEMDRLMLTDGMTYPMKLFYAQRQSNLASFDLQTNMVLQPPVLTASGTAGFD